MPSNFYYIGVDVSGSKFPLTYAILGEDGYLVTLAGGSYDDFLEFLTGKTHVCVAINAPPRPNQGIIRKRLESSTTVHGSLRGIDMRIAEYELRARGIHVSATPPNESLCPGWLRSGFFIYKKLVELGFNEFMYGEESQKFVLETHPQAAFYALLGTQPLPKPTLEGRLQRQLILHENRMDILDPMDFFEEITRHKLLHGKLPLGGIYSSEELDALVAVYTAHLVMNKPSETMWIGDRAEGGIFLPVPELKSTYA